MHRLLAKPSKNSKKVVDCSLRKDIMAKKKWNIRSIFFEDEPVKKGGAKGAPAKSAPAPTSSKKAPAAAPQRVAVNESSETVGTSDGEVSDKFIKVLMAAMEEANLPGFDYLEYKKSLQNLKKMNFTDDVRFQTAYAAAQSMGVTPAQLVDSAQHYLNTLKKEQAKFSQALSGQKAQQVSSKQDELKQLDTSIARQEAKIKELQAEIEKTKTRQKKLQGDIARSNAKLSKTQADFETTFKILTAGIEDDVTKMKQYLK